MAKIKSVHEKSCVNCKHLEYDEDCNSDGYVNELNSGYICNGNKHQGIRNLKYFPFRTEQKCHESEVK